MLGAIKNYLQKRTHLNAAKPAPQAYDLWADSYDMQPGNLMMDLDEEIFSALLKDIDLSNKTVADIGCGTGRHWKKLYACSPVMVRGYDVSEGMLKQLKLKFPEAVTTHILNNRLVDTESLSLDCIISTLTIAHIKDLEETIAAWARVLKTGADIILTDFHPDMLAKGGRRTFRHGDRQMAVVNFVHPLGTIKDICKKHGLIVVREEERYVDETVRPYYEKQNAMPVYEKFKGMAVIYGLHLKKKHVAQ